MTNQAAERMSIQDEGVCMRCEGNVSGDGGTQEVEKKENFNKTDLGKEHITQGFKGVKLQRAAIKS